MRGKGVKSLKLSKIPTHTVYYLDENHAIHPAETLVEQRKAWENRRVAEDHVNGIWISTVFLSFDHNLGGKDQDAGSRDGARVRARGGREDGRRPGRGDRCARAEGRCVCRGAGERREGAEGVTSFDLGCIKPGGWSDHCYCIVVPSAGYNQIPIRVRCCKCGDVQIVAGKVIA